MIHTYWVYILASKRNGTLYIGVTNDLARRIWEHREGTFPGFTSRYGVYMLVWCEAFKHIEDAITFEKAPEEVESKVETASDRRTQSRLE